jgi:TPR repeat protein
MRCLKSEKQSPGLCECLEGRRVASFKLGKHVDSDRSVMAILAVVLLLLPGCRHKGKSVVSVSKTDAVRDVNSVEGIQGRAEQGDAAAQGRLGFMYATGKGAVQDFNEATKWYSKAAAAGSADGQFNLGLMYSRGEGVAADSNEAVKWYAKAAEQGYAPAQYNLALKYAKGDGTTQDYKEAGKWYMAAAKQGYAAAQYNLATMYVSGHGVAEDYVEAYKWMLIAERGGSKMAAAKKDVLRGQLTPSQIIEGERLAQEFAPAKPQ